EKWIEVTIANYKNRGYGMSALELKTSGAVIGFCGIVHPDQQPEPEIKYALLKHYWGRGLASEAVAGMLMYGRTTLGLPRIIATVAPDNVASQRILIKSGLVEVERRFEDGAEVTVVFETV
ncbi:MAG: GNAT family N-acetyltransferase, partial [Gammaproteobacteria bacterium]|nr:GNAT family N-acetyltransferase [Gammaproteobacteria bacterium]